MPEYNLEDYFSARSSDPVPDRLNPQMVRTLGDRRRTGRIVRNAVAVVAVVAVGGAGLTYVLRPPGAVPAGQVTLPTTVTSPTSAPVTTAPSESPRPTSTASKAPLPSGTSRVASTPARTVSPVVVAGDTLSTTGIGALALGMSTSELAARGVLNGTPGNCAVDETPTLTSEGIAIYTSGGVVTGIHLVTAKHSTRSGIAIGATIAQVEAAYGSSATVQTITYGSTQTKRLDVLVVNSAGHDVIFLTQNETTRPSDVVRRIVLTYDGYQVLDRFC